MDPRFPVVSVGPCTFFAATLDKVQYDYHPHAAQVASSVLNTVKKFKNINRFEPEQQLLTLPTKSLSTQVCELEATVPLSLFYSVCTVCDWKAMPWLQKIALQIFLFRSCTAPCNNPCPCITYSCFYLKGQCHEMFCLIFFSNIYPTQGATPNGVRNTGFQQLQT